MNKVRRVVTGQRKDGRSVFVSDEEIVPIEVGLMPGGAFHRIWGSDQAPALPSSGEGPAARARFPPPAGFRFALITIPPDAPPPAGPPPESALAELRSKLPGMLEVLEPHTPGMHTTDSIDFCVILSGQIALELDD